MGAAWRRDGDGTPVAVSSGSAGAAKTTEAGGGGGVGPRDPQREPTRPPLDPGPPGSATERVHVSRFHRPVGNPLLRLPREMRTAGPGAGGHSPEDPGSRPPSGPREPSTALSQAR